MTLRKNTVFLSVIIVSLILWGVLLYYVGADAIVSAIGVENTYWVVFCIALFGGMSSFSGASYVAAITTFASGGADPFLLALASGIGISIGDTIYYYISRRGHRFIQDSRFAPYVERVTNWLNQRNRITRWLGIYVYTGFTPLPNDVLTISLGLTRQPYLLVITSLACGNFTLTFLIATLGQTLF